MKHKKRIALILVAATLLTLCVGSFAYFTDRVTGSTSATAGTLDIALAGLAPSAPENFRPTQGVAINYTLTNEGNKSADIKETFVLTYSPKTGVSSSLTQANPEFAIYAASDVSLNTSTGFVTVNAGATPLSSYVDGTHIKYEVPQFVMNGKANSTGRETETGAVDSKSGAYVLVFQSHAGNSFQGATLTLEYEAQAKQHRNMNTTDAAWAAVQSQTITFGGNSAHKAVPTLGN